MRRGRLFGHKVRLGMVRNVRQRETRCGREVLCFGLGKIEVLGGATGWLAAEL